MKLKNKLFLSHILICVVSLGVIFIYANTILKNDKWENIKKVYEKQLKQIDFAITNLLKETEYDIKFLSTADPVRNARPGEYTNFINADERNFVYSFTPGEKDIIKILNDYRATRPYVNSVYIGFDNGAFVRSHKRAAPTKYDPRKRPWYILAEKNPGEIMRTAPYKSVTTDDINIGTVTEFKTAGGNTGVIGTDITLANLSGFLASTNVGSGSYIYIIDENGVILSHPEKSFRFKKMSEVMPVVANGIFKTGEGCLKTEGKNKGFNLFYTSRLPGWKLCAFVPARVIYSEINKFTLSGIMLLAVLLGLSTVIGMFLSGRIMSPLYGLIDKMRRLADDIMGMKPFKKLDDKSNDEISVIAHEFNLMADSLAVLFTELKRSNMEIEKFMMITSHDLREMLRNIHISGEIIEKKYLTGFEPEAGKNFEIMMSGVRDLSDFITEVLEYTGERNVLSKKIFFETAEIVESIIKESYKNRHDVKFEIDYESMPAVEAMKSGIKHVFRNLVSNAVKFNNNSVKRVNIRSYREENNNIFVIEDNGIGLDKKYTEKIFEFSEKLHTREEYPGFGIGLSLARDIIREHGGDMWVESEKGAGSRFYFSMPG